MKKEENLIEKGMTAKEVVRQEASEKEKDDVKKPEKFVQVQEKEKFDIINALKIVSPGAPLRAAIDDIVKARRGALIAVDSELINGIVEGGLKLNCKFTPQRLFELSKMDGALVLSKDLKRIIYANSLLAPNSNIPTNETGTRHKAAERTAKQAKTLVIAISEKKNTVNLYYSNLKYTLKNTEQILSRTIDELQVLDKQREIYNNLLSNLNTLEVTNLVSMNDVTSSLQRIELISRIAEMINRNVVELGNEGHLVKIRLRELTKGIEKDKRLILKDYTSNYNRYQKEVSKLSFDNLLDLAKMTEIIFGEIEEEYIKAKGYRLLENIDFPDEEIAIIINKFPDVNKLLEANKEDFEKFFKNKDKADKFAKEISDLKEKIIMGKSV